MSGIGALVDQLRDQQVAVRAAAAEQLCQMGEEAREAAAALTLATGDEESVSTWAVAALEEIDPPPGFETMAALIELSANSQESVAYWAITLLGRLGADAKDAEQALVTALGSSPHLAVQQRSAWALGKLGALSAAATESLRQASQATDPRLADLATRALAAGR